MRELAQLILDAAGADVPIEHVDRRPGEVERNFAIAARAREVLGWRAEVALEDGLAETVEWFRATARS